MTLHAVPEERLRSDEDENCLLGMKREGKRGRRREIERENFGKEREGGRGIGK